MLSREDKYAANKMIHELRSNPPVVTQEHKNEGKKILKQHKENQAQKDREIKGELKDFAKDLSGHIYNKLSGVGQMFHGIGEGKKKDCSYCMQHHTAMYHMSDGKWYCGGHKWFGNLTEEQKRKEQVPC